MDKHKCCLIISGGAFCELPKDLPEIDYVIACDGGLDHADRYGIRPDITVGDFDSVSEENRKRINNKEINSIRYPSEKDDTDTSIALKRALELGYKDLRMVCVFGNRMDHTMANIQTAHYGAVQGAMVSMYGEDTIAMVFADSSVVIDRKEGYGLSVFSLSDESTGVTISGTKYKMTEGVMYNSFAIGQSNEFDDNTARVSVKNGVLMVIVDRRY